MPAVANRWVNDWPLSSASLPHSKRRPTTSWVWPATLTHLTSVPTGTRVIVGPNVQPWSRTTDDEPSVVVASSSPWHPPPARAVPAAAQPSTSRNGMVTMKSAVRRRMADLRAVDVHRWYTVGPGEVPPAGGSAESYAAGDGSVDQAPPRRAIGGTSRRSDG